MELLNNTTKTLKDDLTKEIRKQENWSALKEAQEYISVACERRGVLLWKN